MLDLKLIRDNPDMVRAGLRRRGADPTPVDRALAALLLLFPNLPHESVPAGADASANVVLRTWGTAPQFGFKPRDHADLGTQLRILGLGRGAEVSGSRFYYLRGAGVL